MYKADWADKLEAVKKQVDSFGNVLIETFHYLALFVIGACIIGAALHALLDMLGQDKLTIGDILLLFIYLELSAMVGIYFKTNLMPVRCLIYITITALCRLLIGDIQAHHQVDASIIYIALAILLLAISGFVIKVQKDETKF
jgi:protein PsiE